MGLHPGQGDFIPALALGIGNNADIHAFIFQDRPLFDMGFKIGPHRMGINRGLVFAHIADAFKFLAHGFAIDIGAGMAVFQIKHLGKHPRCHHCRGKARSFLVGPAHDLHRGFGFIFGIIQGTDHFQPA